MRRTPDRRRSLIVHAAPWLLIAAFIAVNARWLWLYRHGQPVDIDEAGYLSVSLIDYYGLHFGGYSGWISAITMPSIQAPLTPALSSLVYVIGGPHIILGFAIPLATGAASVAATYWLALSIGPCPAGIMAAVLTASCPAIVNEARSYHFSLPATLAATLALIAIVRSRRFRSVGWTLIFGICLGLMPLARTMTLAFIPGIVVAALIFVLVDPLDRLRRISMFAGSVVVGALVATTWYWENGTRVAEYLLNFGYGAHALEYGPRTSKFGLDAWVSAAQAFVNEAYLPHFLVILLGALASVSLLLRTVVQTGIRPTMQAVLHSRMLPIVIFTAGTVAVLVTTSNKGIAFFAPILPSLMVLTSCAFVRLGGSRSACIAVVPLVIVVSIVVLVPLLDLRTPFAPGWLVSTPILGLTTVTDGRGSIQRYEFKWGYGSPNEAQPVDDATGRAWIDLSIRTADILTEAFGPPTSVAFGFRNQLYNVNTLNLQEVLRADREFDVRQIDPITSGETVRGYLDWLQQQGEVCALLTSDRQAGDFAPAINRTFMEEAARQGGFTPVRSWPAPDGQQITLWTQSAASSKCIYRQSE